jgi:hypothetical protein
VFAITGGKAMKAPRSYGRWLGLCVVLLLWATPGRSAAQEICGEFRTELIAGRHSVAGVVDISHDEATLYVTLSTDGWAIRRSQVHVAETLEGIPQTRWWSFPRVRRFDYAHAYDMPVVTDTYAIGLEELGIGAGGAECIDRTLVLAVHALVVPTTGGRRFPRSAWAAGSSFSRPGFSRWSHRGFSRWVRPMYVEYDLQCCAGGGPVIAVEPESHDFGAPYIGCQAEQTYTISNLGNADLVIHDLQFATGSADLSFDPAEASNGPLPWTLPPGSAAEVFVGYAPLDEFPDSAYLTVSSNDPLYPEVVVTADGSGTFYGEQHDVIEQTGGMVDILFTLDRSASMNDDNALVVANFGTFIDTLIEVDADYHVAVAVEDDGCILGSDAYIDNTFSPSDAQSTFETQADIYLTLGTYGANTERGFSLAEAALKPGNTGPGGCNEGFYREDADLALVHVSDEAEQSINPYTYYVSQFQALKADPEDVVINAVAGDYPSGCGSASAGTGYYEATVATGGLFLSICATDWGSHLEQLAYTSGEPHDSIELTQLPVPETIEVQVDGIQTTTGWQYDASINAIVFERDHIPPVGATIEVEYSLMPDCEG